MQPDDLAPMRQAGLGDRAILEANLVVAYFAYANRVASGLGVQLEPRHQADEPG
jgi:alkylhydroperoxidase family enzyme